MVMKMIECVYRNDTDRMVIVKCVGTNHFYREKVMMPTEVFKFEAPEEARLEIWKMSMTEDRCCMSAPMSAITPCRKNLLRNHSGPADPRCSVANESGR